MNVLDRMNQVVNAAASLILEHCSVGYFLRQAFEKVFYDKHYIRFLIIHINELKNTGGSMNGLKRPKCTQLRLKCATQLLVGK